MAIDKEQILTQIAKFIIQMFQKDKTPMVSVTIPLGDDDKTPVVKPIPIDWKSPDSNITEHFTVADACMLHSWNRLANEIDGLNDDGKAKLVALCQKMEEVRALLGCPINVHCMYRSTQYNIEQKILLPTGADVHSMFLACDFDANSHMSIEQAKTKIQPELARLGIRMERGTTTWVHLDLRAPGPSGRYFTA